jgi:Lysyl oxidase
MNRALVRTLPALAAAVCLAIAALAVDHSAASRAATATERLPDLEQAVPSGLEITEHKRAPHWRLGFRSAVSNVGDGPLIISGRRPVPGVEKMVADQVIELDGAPVAVVPGTGRLRYVRAKDHRHWHLLGFDRYEMRRPGGRTLVRDRKSGVCLGGRYALTGRDLPASPPAKVYTSRCGLDHPELMGVREGISVGYGDDYVANLEGQWLPLDGLRAGRYLLVHRTNADGRLRERTRDNNEASVLFRLRWRHKRPVAKILAGCPAGEVRCAM